jgi:Secretion system C-terminal sorting domain
MPLDAARHEFSHSLYGGNTFHTAGGGWSGGSNPDYWIPVTGGWSNMSLAGASINSWNGWDRLRLDWKPSANAFNPSARNASLIEVNGDLDANNPSQAGIYILRDFVTTGDAIRIKLPFLDPTNEYPEFIWIENHRGMTANGSPFDKWKFEDPSNPCIDPMTSGIYMYMQIDKDIRQGTTNSQVFGGWGNYTRPITADGFSDRIFESNQVYNNCIAWQNTNAFVKVADNPFTGAGDQEAVAVDINNVNNNNQLNAFDLLQNHVEKKNGTYYYNLFSGGNPRHAFTLAGNKKLGIGTNPSSASLINLVSYNAPATGNSKNVRKTYLNGISVEILNQYSNGDIQIKVLFNDVDVDNDARWCSPEIVLNPISSASGYSLNLKTGKTITLDQGTTASKIETPIFINGSPVFASNTLMRCKAGTWINMETGSSLIIDNKSTLQVEAGAKIDIANGATLRVKRGSNLKLLTGSTINVADGGKIIIEEDPLNSANDGLLDYYPDAKIYLNGLNAVLEIAGKLNIQNNADFTFQYTNSQHGFVKFSKTNAWPSFNITAGANCKMTFNGSMKYRKMLEISQETLYGPNNLIAFTVTNGTTALHNDSRLQPSFGGVVTINNARFTSNISGTNNQHRGVHLYGQANVTVSNCTFEYGKYGLYGFLTYGGVPMQISNCIFRHNTSGLFMHDKGITINSCNFYNNDIGWKSDLMSFPCRSNYGIAGGSLINKNTIAYDYSGSGSSPLWIEDPFINWNTYGVKTKGDQCNTTVHCGSVSFNEIGFYNDYWSRLTMDENVSSKGAQVTAFQNATTIKLNQAAYVNLNKGANELTPSNLINACVNGSMIPTGPIPIQCNNNKWNNLATFSQNDYSVTNLINNTQMQLNDASPLSPMVACGQGIPPCPNPPCDNLSDALAYCPLCDIINTDDFVNDKLNDAAKDAIQEMKSSNPDNFILAVGLFRQILLENYINPDSRESYILDISYTKMLEALGNAFLYNQVSAAENTPILSNVVLMVIEVQDKLILDASNSGNYYMKFILSLDKANVLRLADRRDLALAFMGSIESWVQPDEIGYFNNLKCNFEIENKILLGEIPKENFEQALSNCLGGGSSNRMAQTSSNPNPSLANLTHSNALNSDAININIFPNPVLNVLNVLTTIEAGEIQIFNSIGKKIVTEKFYSETSIDMSTMSPGIYMVHLIDLNTNKKYFEKIVLKK